MKTLIKKILFITLFCATSVFFSCKSTEVVITDNLTHAQLIQKGQDMVARQKYKDANKYFMASLEKYGSDLKCYVEARYEVAHCFYKQKNYDNAKTMFEEIITIYDSPQAMYQIQPKYKKLASMSLDKIKQIEEQKSKKDK